MAKYSASDFCEYGHAARRYGRVMRAMGSESANSRVRWEVLVGSARAISAARKAASKGAL